MRRQRLWIFGIIILSTGCLFIGSRLLNRPKTNTTQIRYTQPEAAEVFLMWGVNGWQIAPTTSQPLGTVVRDGVMYTPMTRTRDTFTVIVTLTPGTTLNYGFLITRAADGSIVSSWEANGSDDFKYVVLGNGIKEHVSSLTPSDENPVAVLATSSPLDIKIRTFQPQAGELFLVWGVNGWNVLPQPLRPAGTTTIKGIMHTPMKPDGLSFVADLKLPAGVTIDYGFLITRKRTGEAGVVWQADDQSDFHATVNKPDVLIHNKSADLSGIAERTRPLSPNWGLVTLLGLLSSAGIVAWKIFPDRRQYNWKQNTTFFLACGLMLAIILTIIRAYLLGFHWITWSVSWVIVPVALVAAVYDWGYVTVLTFLFLFISWGTRSYPQVQRLLTSIFVGIATFSLACALVNVQTFYLAGQPITLIYCTPFLGDINSWGAITNHNFLLLTTFLIMMAATLLVSSAWLGRGISGWALLYSTRARGIILSSMMAVLVAYLMLTHWVLSQRLWETKQLLNPTVTLTQSVVNPERCSAFTYIGTSQMLVDR